MQFIIDIIVFLLTLFILITVHEWGHFWVARRFGVKTLCFSIGFGKALWRRIAKDGTEYRIAVLPFGGYVKLLDEREGEVTDDQKHLAFNRKPVWARAAIVLAGPLINVLLAFIVFTVVFWIGFEQSRPIIGQIEPQSIAEKSGLQPNTEIVKIDNQAVADWQKALVAIVMRLGDKNNMQIVTRPINKVGDQQSYSLPLQFWQVNELNPDPLKALGIIPYRPKILPVVAEVKENSPAEKAGLQKGDKVLAVDQTAVADWTDFALFIHSHPGKRVIVRIERNGQMLQKPVVIGRQLAGLHWVGYMGIASGPVDWPHAYRTFNQYPLTLAWLPAWQEMVLLTKFNFVTLGKVIIGEISLKSLGGPISIFRSTSQAYLQGFIVYLSFLAFISLMLAWINILPIPGLDGGHLFFYLIEIVRGKPLSVRTEALILRLGIIFLIVIMLQATINDLLRLLA